MGKIIVKPLENNSTISDNVNLYFHFPACANQCAFCDYFTYLGKTIGEEFRDNYNNAIIKELVLWIRAVKKNNKKVKFPNIYFGGGTPLLWFSGKNSLKLFVDSLLEKVNLDDIEEISIEVHPLFWDEIQLNYLASIFKNKLRISIGLQSLNGSNVQLIRKLRGSLTIIYFERFWKLMDWCKNKPVSINIDFMYGLKSSYITDELDLIEANRINELVGQFTFYHIYCPEDFYRWQLYVNSVDDHLEKLIGERLAIFNKLNVWGFKPSIYVEYFEKEHNLNNYNKDQLNDNDYISLGLSSHGKIGNFLYCNYADWKKYGTNLDDERYPIEKYYQLKGDEGLKRKLFLNLRLPGSYLDFEQLNLLFGESTDTILTNFFDKDENEKYHLNQKGIINLPELLDFCVEKEIRKNKTFIDKETFYILQKLEENFKEISKFSKTSLTEALSVLTNHYFRIVNWITKNNVVVLNIAYYSSYFKSPFFGEAPIGNIDRKQWDKLYFKWNKSQNRVSFYELFYKEILDIGLPIPFVINKSYVVEIEMFTTYLNEKLNAKFKSEELNQIFEIFKLFTKSYDVNWLYFIGIKTSMINDSTGGLIISTKKEVEASAIYDIGLLFSQTLQMLNHIENLYANRMESLKSAIAAIMARNGSHNIGSHILSNISHKILNPLDVLFLIKYIQQRWDFLAQVASPDWPKWTLPMRFMGQIMRGFFEQRLLLNNIAESEDLAAQEDFNDGANLKHRISFDIKMVDGEGTEKKEDVSLAIPGGITGVHAFYSILENIIRNTAKHAYKNEEDGNRKDKKGVPIPDGLRITIEVKDDLNKDYVEFFISDNWTKNNPEVKPEENTKHKISDAIKERLIKDDGSLNYENWGIAEMKISALYLRKEDIQELNPPTDEDFTFRIVENDGKKEPKGTIAFEEHQSKLAYHFAIPKPKEVGVVYTEERNGGKIENRTQPDSKYNQYGVWKAKKDQGDFDFILEGEEVSSKKASEEQNDQQENAEHASNSFNSLTNEGTGESEANDNTPDTEEQWNARRGGLEVGILKSNPFSKLLKEKPTEKERKKEKKDVETEKLKLFDERIKTLITANGLKPEDIHLFINPSETGGGNGSGNKEKVAKYYFDNFRKDFDKLLRINAEKEEAENIRQMLNPEYEKNFISDPWSIFKKHFSDKHQNLFEKILVSQNSIFRNYNKYEEDIETVPKELLSKGDGGEKKLNISYWFNSYGSNQEIEDLKTLSRITIDTGYPNDKEIQSSILFKRHLSRPYGIDDKGEKKVLYAEALSGAQSYFSLLKNPQDDYYSRIKMIYELMETALLKITIIDERFENYLKEVHDNNLRKIFQALGIDNITLNEFLETLESTNENTRSDNEILIIHLAMLQKAIGIVKKKRTKKEDNSYSNKTNGGAPQYKEKEQSDHELVLDEIYEVYGYKKENIFITTGKGRAEIPEEYKYIPFADIRSSIIKPYPEKYLLVKTLMKITPKPKSESNGER
ncbi:MAG: hypothetical protein K9H15_05015 [Bacteroidales bacterium]|nr:hypothetical protein [Bacteroidales bacterium]